MSFESSSFDDSFKSKSRSFWRVWSRFCFSSDMYNLFEGGSEYFGSKGLSGGGWSKVFEGFFVRGRCGEANRGEFLRGFFGDRGRFSGCMRVGWFGRFEVRMLGVLDVPITSSFFVSRDAFVVVCPIGVVTRIVV